MSDSHLAELAPWITKWKILSLFRLIYPIKM